MANWAYSYYVIVGDKEQLDKLYSIMSELEDMQAPGLHDNGFGSTWLGNLVIKLGGDWNKVYCRGSWDDLRRTDDSITFSVESAWGELDEVREFILSHFRGISIYYQCVEEGCGVFQTNDNTGVYFPEKYYLWVEDTITEYYSTFDALAKEVEKLTGADNLLSLDDCNEAMELYSQHNNELAFTIEEFEVVEC